MKFKSILDRAKAMLRARKPMSSTRKKLKRAKTGFNQPGAGGEYRNLRANPDSGIGKLQEHNRRQKELLDQL